MNDKTILPNPMQVFYLGEKAQSVIESMFDALDNFFYLKVFEYPARPKLEIEIIKEEEQGVIFTIGQFFTEDEFDSPKIFTPKVHFYLRKDLNKIFPLFWECEIFNEAITLVEQDNILKKEIQVEKDFFRMYVFIEIWIERLIIYFKVFRKKLYRLNTKLL